MPASDPREDQRFARALPVMFWVGVGLAPLAALILLIGSSTGSLRAAIGLVIISVILIGLSITLRRDTENLRSELEDTVFDEIDVVRADVRDDIGHAVQATHRAFGEKMQYLMDQLEATRVELESTRAQLEAIRHQPLQASHRAGPPGPGQAAGRAQSYPPGIVRHTETVQVTTRHTVMDPNEERGTTYGTRQPVTARGGGADQSRDDSWTDQRLREQLDRRREAYDDDDDDDRRPSVRAGDRWASVRQDDHGRELRMGERRAGLYSDGRGTELRIEDRWAAVRREAGLDRASRWEDREAGLDRPQRWEDEDPYRERERERRAISGSDREERWSDYRDERERYR